MLRYARYDDISGQRRLRQLQVLDEARELRGARVLVGQAQQIAGMHRDPCRAAVRQALFPATFAADRHDLAEQAARRGRAQRYRHLRTQQQLLLLDPPATRLDLARVRLGVDAALAARLKLEVLDRVGDIGLLAGNPGRGEGAVEHLTGRSDERMAGEILLIAGLLTDEHHRRRHRAFAEHGLRRVLVEVAARARGGFVAQRFPGEFSIAADFHAVAGPFDHSALPCLRAGQQLWDQRGFRHVLPVFTRHLFEHRVHLDARRVEDAGVIGLPHFLDRIALRRLAAHCGRPFAQPRAVPVDRDLGGEDRPAHRGEAVDEEGGVGADDVMLGLEPRDIAVAVIVTYAAEADEGAHLVDVTPHRLGQTFEPADERVGMVLDQPRHVAQPPQQGVQQREPLGIVMKNRVAGQRDERTRHAQRRGGGGRRSGGRRRGREQILRRRADLPDDAVRRHVGGDQRARRLPPCVHVIGRGKGGDTHRP
ncbi:hypothetical protein SPHINGO8AM_190046 [Sphingomonas sp. 8AM]|nr:hypothetical protein SPHINGO8AM_190046 [Sphingomonas sp. 8AM]